MRLLTTVTFIAVVLFWSHPLYAVDLASKHHLWSVVAPNGTKSYIAVSGAPTDERGVRLLKAQLDAAASVRRVAIFSQHHDLSLQSDAWNRRADEALPEDLLTTLETELAPSVLVVFGTDSKSVRRLKLAGVRLLLYGSAKEFYSKGHSPTEKILTAFQRERGGVLTLKPVTYGEVQASISKAQARETRSPVEIIRTILRERHANGAVGDRIASAFLMGNWETLEALASHQQLIAMGFESTALERSDFESTNDLVDHIFSPLSDMPTLVMVPSNQLVREPSLFAVLQQRGFDIKPLPLSR